MLEKLIEKYQAKPDINEIVYKLSYAGRYIIIKGKTLTGSMVIIENTYADAYYGILISRDQARAKNYENHLYKRLYDHFYQTESIGRFRIKTLARTGVKITQYQLLKREQMELDKAQHDKRCLNNAREAYIPKFNSKTHTFGWINYSAVASFKAWLVSKERIAYLKRYVRKLPPKPAKRGPSART